MDGGPQEQLAQVGLGQRVQTALLVGRVTQVASRAAAIETGKLQDRSVYLGIDIFLRAAVADQFNAPPSAVNVIKFAHAPTGH